MDQATQDRPSVYVSNGHVYYRASALGNCPRALYAARNGELPVAVPETIQKAFDRGIESEPIAIAQLRANGFTVINEQKESVLPITANISVVGHIDGMAVRAPVLPDYPLALLEVKAFASSTLDTWLTHKLDGFPHYKWQLSAYCHALGLECVLFVIFNHDEPDPSKRLKLFKIPKEQLFNKGEIIARILSIENAVTKQQLPVCEPPNFFCPYPYLHEENRPKDDVVDLTVREGLDAYPNLRTIIDEYVKTLAIQKQASDMTTKLRAKILAFKVPAAKTDKHIIRVTDYESSSLDKEKLDSVLSNLMMKYDDFIKHAPAQRLTVEEIK